MDQLSGLPRGYDPDLIPRHDDSAAARGEAGSMSTASPENAPSSPRPPVGSGRPPSGDDSFDALVYAAGTLIQVGTRATPYVRTLDLASRPDLGARSR